MFTFELPLLDVDPFLPAVLFAAIGGYLFGLLTAYASLPLKSKVKKPKLQRVVQGVALSEPVSRETNDPKGRLGTLLMFQKRSRS
jgi:hypothetical protein